MKYIVYFLKLLLVYRGQLELMFSFRRPIESSTQWHCIPIQCQRHLRVPTVQQCARMYSVVHTIVSFYYIQYYSIIVLLLRVYKL